MNIVWAPASKPQRALLSCPVFEVFFGGACGGGKTDCVGGKWAQHAVRGLGIPCSGPYRGSVESAAAGIERHGGGVHQRAR